MKTITIQLLLWFASPHRTENDPRETQSHMDQSHLVWSETIEHRSFLRTEEAIVSRTLSFDYGHGYAQEHGCTQEEHTTKREMQHVNRTVFTAVFVCLTLVNCKSSSLCSCSPNIQQQTLINIKVMFDSHKNWLFCCSIVYKTVSLFSTFICINSDDWNIQTFKCF